MYLDSTEATGSQPHVMEGQSDGEGVTKLNHKVTDSLQKRLSPRLRRGWRDGDGETKTTRPRWSDEENADRDCATKRTPTEMARRRRHDGAGATKTARRSWRNGDDATELARQRRCDGAGATKISATEATTRESSEIWT